MATFYGARFSWFAFCQQCEVKKPFKDADERDTWVKEHRKHTEHRVEAGAGPLPKDCPMCDNTDYLPSGIPCDHTDYDGRRVQTIRQLRKQYPACAVCGAPCVTGRKKHFSCQ